MVYGVAICAGLLVAVAHAFAGEPGDFSHKPVYIDPALGGWSSPAQTLSFQVGCGQMYFVEAIRLGDRRELQVVSRSKITFRRDFRRELGCFAEKLAAALATMVEDLAGKGVLDGVVLTFYTAAAKGNVVTLETHECCLPAHGFGSLGPIPLRVTEHRVEELSRP